MKQLWSDSELKIVKEHRLLGKKQSTEVSRGKMWYLESE